MAIEPIPAYVSSESPLEITVNLGIVAGRDASRQEVDSLGETLLSILPGATVFVGSRYEFASAAAEVVGHEVVIRVPDFGVPADPHERQDLVNRLLDVLGSWAFDCAARVPPGGEDLTTRIIRASTLER